MTKFRLIPYAVLTAAGILAVSGGANAQSMYEINQRQDAQQERIERGIRDGQITRSEAARLEQGERNIDRAQRRAEADGHVTPQERARIDRMTNRESREIYQDSHNRQQAWDRGQQWGHTDGREGWGDRREDRREARDGRENRREGWGDRREAGRDSWGTRTPGIDRREANQDNRIYNGVRDGQLTRGEYNHLERGQDRIQNAEARARADGHVTGAERDHIQNMQNRESRDIYRDRHNDRTPGGTGTGSTGTGSTGTGATGTGTANNGWNHGGGNHGTGTTPGTGTGTTGTGSTGTGTASNGSHSGGWTHGSTGTGTTGTTTASSGAHTWGTGSSGSTRTASSAGSTPRTSVVSSSSGGGRHR